MQVFITYSQNDEALATKVVAVLEGAGLRTWYDKHEIYAGDNWAEKIGEALKESDAMVVLLTPHAFDSTNVRYSIEYALGEMRFENRLIPVIVGDMKDFEPDQIPWILKYMRTIQLPKNGSDQEQLNQIAEALQEVA